MSVGAQGCWHCGEPLPLANAPQAVVGGVAHDVCCIGCRAAAEWIDTLGLADYYRLRSAPAQRPIASTGGSGAALARPEIARQVVRDLGGDRREAVVLVEGIRCSACVWLIERGVGSLDGVASVDVNALAQRARFVFDDARCSLAQIVDALARMGYSAEPLTATALTDARRRENRAALKRLAVAGIGAMQAMTFASALYFGAVDAQDAATRDLFRWLAFLTATPVVLYSARPFFAGAIRALAARRLSVDVPVALAIALVYAASLVIALRGGADVYFDSVSMFVFFLLVGRYAEMRARHRAGDLTDALARSTPAFADRVRADGTHERVAVLELVAGDRVHVAAGARIPADGMLETARCRVDESALTGESVPLVKTRGDALVAGSVVVDGPAALRVERVGPDTVVAGIVALATSAQAARPRLARAGERAAALFVGRVLALAAITAVGWSFVDPVRAFEATLAVLVVSCPCAFALAVPAALTRALGLLAQRGVLVVRPDAIEHLAAATHVIFDKTGTLTDIAFDRVEPMRNVDRDAALALAASLARGSRHPAAEAIAAAAGDARVAPVAAWRSHSGAGVEGEIDGCRLRLGSPSFALESDADSPKLDGAVVLADDAGAIAAFHFTERVRPDAPAAVAALAAQGLAIEIASGDTRAKVAAVAARLSIDRFIAGARPADKLARLAALRAGGSRVIAVGDGINDAPVLAGADVAIALASGTEIAQASSDIVLSSGRLAAIAQACDIARRTLAVLRQNQRWAMGYNLAVVPLGALGFVPPWLAAIGMSVSSLVVVLNALRIGRRKPRDGAPAATLVPGHGVSAGASG
ncbi:MAG TPA: heavy metal translocating P-type ATPase [Casimicrobiaceae bacterium]|nr:heavy metal translocating P-type ATPase [Casimicrobiaceae bacterium]